MGAPFDAASLVLQGTIPNVDAAAFTVFRVRLFDLISGLARNGAGPFRIIAGYGDVPTPQIRQPRQLEPQAEKSDDSTRPIAAMTPMWRLDQIVLPQLTMGRLLDCAAFIDVAPQVFDIWNLRAIEPHPSIAVNFRGPSGTGKTMAAHGLAHALGRKIITSRLSDLESKYHGDGPKNVAHLFRSAASQDAVIFIDEAESLLSRRFAQPEQAAESAINSMRTELLMALDSFDGLAIFASNLHGSYDQAISSRLIHVDFALPNQDERRRLWRSHLPPELPLAEDVAIDTLSEIDGITGRDIKQAVLAAAVSTARRKLPAITSQLLRENLVKGEPDEQHSAALIPNPRVEPLDDSIRQRIIQNVTEASTPLDRSNTDLY